MEVFAFQLTDSLIGLGQNWEVLQSFLSWELRCCYPITCNRMVTWHESKLLLRNLGCIWACIQKPLWAPQQVITVNYAAELKKAKKMQCLIPSCATGSRTWSDLIMIAWGMRQTPDAALAFLGKLFCLVPLVWVGHGGPWCTACCSNTQATDSLVCRV